MNSPAANVKITRLLDVDENALTQVNTLLPQLTSNFKPLTLDKLSSIVQAATTAAYVAVDTQTDTIIGMLLMITVHQFVGTKCWIEDLVVSSDYRGRGIAQLLINEAIANAPKNVRSINLASKPSRTSANRLYTKAGFAVQDTLMFRIMPSTRPNVS